MLPRLSSFVALHIILVVPTTQAVTRLRNHLGPQGFGQNADPEYPRVGHLLQSRGKSSSMAEQPPITIVAITLCLLVAATTVALLLIRIRRRANQNTSTMATRDMELGRPTSFSSRQSILASKCCDGGIAQKDTVNKELSSTENARAVVQTQTQNGTPHPKRPAKGFDTLMSSPDFMSLQDFSVDAGNKVRYDEEIEYENSIMETPEGTYAPITPYSRTPLSPEKHIIEPLLRTLTKYMGNSPTSTIQSTQTSSSTSAWSMQPMSPQWLPQPFSSRNRHSRHSRQSRRSARSGNNSLRHLVSNRLSRPLSIYPSDYIPISDVPPIPPAQKAPIDSSEFVCLGPIPKDIKLPPGFQAPSSIEQPPAPKTPPPIPVLPAPKIPPSSAAPAPVFELPSFDLERTSLRASLRRATSFSTLGTNYTEIEANVLSPLQYGSSLYVPSQKVLNNSILGPIRISAPSGISVPSAVPSPLFSPTRAMPPTETLIPSPSTMTGASPASYVGPVQLVPPAAVVPGQSYAGQLREPQRAPRVLSHPGADVDSIMEPASKINRIDSAHDIVHVPPFC